MIEEVIEGSIQLVHPWQNHLWDEGMIEHKIFLAWIEWLLTYLPWGYYEDA